MQKRKILFIGSSTMELSLNMFALPEAGQTVVDDGGIAYLPGGGASGVALAMTKLGADCLYCSKLGADAHGQSIYERYRDMGINTSVIMVDHDFPTGLCVSLNEGDGSNRKIIYPGANENLTAENISDAFLENPEFLVLDLSVPAATTLSAARIATSRGVPFAICPSGDMGDISLQTLPTSELFVIDDTQAEKMCGTRPAGADSSLRAALSIFKLIHTKYLVIRIERRGTFFYDGKHYGMVPPIGTVKQRGNPKDLGDSYTGSLILGYLTGGDLKGAVMLAESAMGIFSMKGGQKSSFPTTEEVYDFLSKNRT